MTQETQRSLEMLATALEKEEKGRQFYLGAVAACRNELGKDLFRKLSADEGVHIVRIKEIYEALQGGKPWTAGWKGHRVESEDLKRLFAERMRKLGPKVTAEAGDLDALKIGLEMEQTAITFYEGQLERAIEPLEKDFITLMIAEEQSHYAALKDVIFYLENPESWYTEHEHHVLDGA
jgi:rubrerythrin